MPCLVIRQNKPSSASAYFKTLRRFFNWMIEEGLIAASPMTKIKFKPSTAPRIVTIKTFLTY
jgi:site-specific recombinase XerD